MSKYWLRYIRDCVDNAVMACDAGANPDAVPPSEAKRLKKLGWVKLNNKRLVITTAGRKEAK